VHYSIKVVRLHKHYVFLSRKVIIWGGGVRDDKFHKKTTRLRGEFFQDKTWGGEISRKSRLISDCKRTLAVKYYRISDCTIWNWPGQTVV